MAKASKVVEKDKVVTLEMELHLDDGELLSSTKEEGDLTFTVGDGSIVPGLETALLGLKVGDAFNVVVEPKDGYGEYDEDAFEMVPLDSFEEEIEEGEDYFFEDENGEPVVVTVVEITQEGAVVDFNHPLAGETLSFKGKVLKIE